MLLQTRAKDKIKGMTGGICGRDGKSATKTLMVLSYDGGITRLWFNNGDGVWKGEG